MFCDSPVEILTPSTLHQCGHIAACIVAKVHARAAIITHNPLMSAPAAVPAQLNTIRKAFDPPVWLYLFMITNIQDADHNVHLLV